MIKRFTDHAANERTYLAWIRTSVAIMAFGFLIEKFDLFVKALKQSPDETKALLASSSAEIAGLGIFLIGTLIIFVATIRYFLHKNAIDLDEQISYNEKKTNFILISIIVLLTLFISLYLGHRLFP